MVSINYWDIVQKAISIALGFYFGLVFLSMFRSFAVVSLPLPASALFGLHLLRPITLCQCVFLCSASTFYPFWCAHTSGYNTHAIIAIYIFLWFFMIRLFGRICRWPMDHMKNSTYNHLIADVFDSHYTAQTPTGHILTHAEQSSQCSVVFFVFRSIFSASQRNFGVFWKMPPSIRGLPTGGRACMHIMFGQF